MNCQLERGARRTGQTSMNQQPAFMLFDLMSGGHHGFYIKHIVLHWIAAARAENLIVLVAPDFLRQHADVVALAQLPATPCIHFVAVTPAELSAVRQPQHPLKSMFQEWDIYCKYARKYKIQHALLMYYDLFQMPIALGRKSPCDFSGIYFRPTFHYPTFANYRFSISDYFRQLRQRLVLGLGLRNRRLKNLFSLDPYAAAHMQRFRGYSRVLHLPDPMELQSIDAADLAGLGQTLGIDSHRQVFLLFGSLHERKGVQQVLEAAQQLPEHIAKSVCFLFVGRITSSNRESIRQQIEVIPQKHPVQIVLCDTFVPDEDVQKYFQLADFVLVPYQRHVGMSGIVLQAAVAQKPVLASDYGLIGQIVAANNLGYLMDASSATAIAQRIASCVQEKTPVPYDVASSSKLIQQHDAKDFAANLVRHMLVQ